MGAIFTVHTFAITYSTNMSTNPIYGEAGIQEAMEWAQVNHPDLLENFISAKDEADKDLSTVLLHSLVDEVGRMMQEEEEEKHPMPTERWGSDEAFEKILEDFADDMDEKKGKHPIPSVRSGIAEDDEDLKKALAASLVDISKQPVEKGEELHPTPSVHLHPNDETKIRLMGELYAALYKVHTVGVTKDEINFMMKTVYGD